MARRSVQDGRQGGAWADDRRVLLLTFLCLTTSASSSAAASWQFTKAQRGVRQGLVMLNVRQQKEVSSSFGESRRPDPSSSMSIQGQRRRVRSAALSAPPRRSTFTALPPKTAKAKRDRVQLSSSAPERVERQVDLALESLCSVLKNQRLGTNPPHDGSAEAQLSIEPVETYLFPTTRDCNAALAAFGDGGDLLRALRLFGKMRKAALLIQSWPSDSALNGPYGSTVMQFTSPPSVPAPTLVTYSTLMSRANSLGKPRVSLRLWKLMMNGGNPCKQLVPDTRAVNILLNSYAKLMDLSGAQSIVHQMTTGCGPDVTAQLVPNLVTFNTLLDACLKSGDLDAALRTKAELDATGLHPDARTYTNLIATVARKASAAAGRNDPTLAFSFLDEMKERGVVPNGKTYSALIDAAGRCQRSDLALQGLRIMLRQKEKDVENEVGAWTAAIDACGKAGRVDTAIRLFRTMPNFQVQPNAVTCGCLTDCLLRAGRTADTLDVLRYMKANGIEPTDVMYTSLMTRAEGLARSESQKPSQQRNFNELYLKSSSPSETKAIEVYTELMSSLVESGRSRQLSGDSNISKRKDTLLLKVFLVFQEMKASGTEPDLACYNALLRACARAGDFDRARDVLNQILLAGLEPNDTSWRQLIRAASNIRRSDFAIEIWKQALSYQSRHLTVDEPTILWKPSEKSFGALLLSHLQHAASTDSVDSKIYLYGCVLDLFDGLLLGDENLGLNRIDPNLVLESDRTMLLILQAIVALHDLCQDESKQNNLVTMACSILQLDCLQRLSPRRLHWSILNAYQRAQTWRTATQRLRSG